MLPDPSTIRYLDSNDIVPEKDAQLLDVRSAEAFEEEHLPHSVNLCVYETAFPEKAQKQYADKASSIIAYGQSANFKAAELAAGRLQDLGYRSVSVLRGGIDAWKQNGGEVIRAQKTRPAAERPRRLFLNTEQSKLRWIGRNLTNQHHGELALQSGSLRVSASGEPIDGVAVVDMTTMRCIDIADSKLSKQLIDHLTSGDFFQTDQHPTATFEATAFRRLSEKQGSPNFEMIGHMTIRGVTRDLALPATFARVEHGYVVQANFDLDRTNYGALYGSDNVFERLGMHLVNNLIYLQLVAIFCEEGEGEEEVAP